MPESTTPRDQTPDDQTPDSTEDTVTVEDTSVLPEHDTTVFAQEAEDDTTVLPEQRTTVLPRDADAPIDEPVAPPPSAVRADAPGSDPRYEDPRYGHAPVPDRRLKVTHLVFGLIFLGVAGLWALSQAGLADWTASSYLAPAVLVGAGVVGLLAMVVSSRRHRNPKGA